MSAHVGSNLFHMRFHILYGCKILSENRCQTSAADNAVQVLPPFFQKNLIEGFLGFNDSERCHDPGVQKVVFERIVAQDQYVLRANLGKLIHISQIADHRIEKPGDVLAEGDKVDVKITDVDMERKKISLSIRALLEAPAVETEDSEEDVASSEE